MHMESQQKDDFSGMACCRYLFLKKFDHPFSDSLCSPCIELSLGQMPREGLQRQCCKGLASAAHKALEQVKDRDHFGHGDLCMDDLKCVLGWESVAPERDGTERCGGFKVEEAEKVVTTRVMSERSGGENG